MQSLIAQKNAKYHIKKYENFFKFSRLHIFYCTSRSELLHMLQSTNGHNAPPDLEIYIYIYYIVIVIVDIIPAESLHNKDFYVCYLIRKTEDVPSRQRRWERQGKEKAKERRQGGY